MLNRKSYTLVELLVVLAIITLLAVITLLFLSNRQSHLAEEGASQLQTWLASVRSRALRDQTPTGLRLISNDGGNTFTAAQIIQTPEPYCPLSGNSITITPITPALPSQPYATVQCTASISTLLAGDFLEIVEGTGSINRIASINSNTITLVSQPNFSTTVLPTSIPSIATSGITTLTTNYRFIRQCQPLMGESTFDLPNTVGILSSLSLNVPTSYSGTNLDIIFAPSGQVVNATTGRIVLWVADSNGVSKLSLVTIYTRTGAVAVHPVGPTGSEYVYTQDGLSSGQ